MSVEQLQTFSLVFYIIAGISALAAIALFFLLDIKRVIGDITGATARKAINMIREQNEASGNKAYKPSPVNAARGKLTDKMSLSGKIRLQSSETVGSPGTQKFATTELLSCDRETSVLSSDCGSETTVLKPESDLNINEPEIGFSRKSETDTSDDGADFGIDVEMGFADSSEIIE